MVDEDPRVKKKISIYNKRLPQELHPDLKSKLVVKRQSRDVVVTLYGNICTIQPKKVKAFESPR